MNQYTYRHTSIPHPKQYISQQQLNTIFERLLVIMQISIKLCKTDNQWKIHRRGLYHHHDKIYFHSFNYIFFDANNRVPNCITP